MAADADERVEKTAGKERAVFYFLLLILLAAPLILTSKVSVESGKWYVIQVGGTTLFAAWLLVGVQGGRPRVRWDALTVLAFAFLGTQLLSLAGAANVWESLEIISRQAGLLAIFLLVANVPRDTTDRDRVLWAAALVGAATSIYGIAQHFGYDFFPWQEHREVPVTRGVSFFGHATFSGSVLIITIPIAIGLAAMSKSIPGRIAASVIVLLMMYHLSFSGARIATVGLFVAALVVMGLHLLDRVRARRQKARAQPAGLRGILVGVAILLAVILAGSALSIRAWDVKGGDLLSIRETSLTQRFFAWETASRIFLGNPITGIGVGNYGVESPPYWNAVEASRYARHGRRFFQVHNEYLEVAAEQGLPGITVMLGLMAFALAGSYRLSRQASSARERRLGLALFAAVVATSIDATVTFTLQNPGSALFYWVLWGLISFGLASETPATNTPAGKEKIATG